MTMLVLTEIFPFPVADLTSYRAYNFSQGIFFISLEILWAFGLFDCLARHAMGVNHGGSYVTVTERGLNRPDIIIGLQKIGGPAWGGMAEGVGDLIKIIISDRFVNYMFGLILTSPKLPGIQKRLFNILFSATASLGIAALTSSSALSWTPYARTSACTRSPKRPARGDACYVSQKMDKIQIYRELDVYFHDADHTDIKTIEGEVSLRHFISAMLSYYPWWILFLYRIREVLVNILCLVKHEKPDVLSSMKPEDLSFNPGEKASFFIVRTAKENIYWVSETPEDKHLRAFFGVIAEAMSNHLTRFHVFTAVKYLNWTGPVYFNLIRPFHHLVVSSMMKNGVKQ